MEMQQFVPFVQFELHVAVSNIEMFNVATVTQTMMSLFFIVGLRYIRTAVHSGG
jgi:hypothetical protein